MHNLAQLRLKVICSGTSDAVVVVAADYDVAAAVVAAAADVAAAVPSNGDTTAFEVLESFQVTFVLEKAEI